MLFSIRTIAYWTMKKRICEDKLCIQKISLPKEELSYFNLSSNEIISFDYEGNHYYFRECQKIERSSLYFQNSVEHFFDTIANFGINSEHFEQEIPICMEFPDEIVEKFREYITYKLSRISAKRWLSKTDIRSQKIGFSIWKKQNYDHKFFESFKMEDIPEKLYDIAICFLWYMRSKAAQYRTLRISHGKAFSFFSAAKSMASYIVAEELGVQSLITEGKWCEIDIGAGKKMVGILSPSARGKRMKDWGGEVDGSLQRELTNLNLLDAICYQPDHGPNNYNVYVHDDGICSVCAFDNDNPYTFFPIPLISKELSGCSSLIRPNGGVARPYLDGGFVQKLNKLDIKRLKKRLKPYLNILQIQALIHRIKLLKKAISQSCEGQNSIKLLNTWFQWNNDTLAEERSGKYGVTYVTKAFEGNK